MDGIHSACIHVQSKFNTDVHSNVKGHLSCCVFHLKKPTDNKTLIAILASCGALLIMIVILAVCASHHRKPYNENQVGGKLSCSDNKVSQQAPACPLTPAPPSGWFLDISVHASVTSWAKLLRWSQQYKCSITQKPRYTHASTNLISTFMHGNIYKCQNVSTSSTFTSRVAKTQQTKCSPFHGNEKRK